MSSRPAVAAALILALGGCGEKAAPPEQPAAAVSGERYVVQPQAIDDLKPVEATVTSKDMAEARARIGGVLTRLSVKAGDVVRKGQVLGVVADARIGLQTSAYDAQVSAADAERRRAVAELGRIRNLYDHGVYAKARLEQAEASARAAEGAFRAARAQRAASAEAGAQGAILAPCDGRVLRADVPQGSVVSPGQSIATVTAGRTLIRVDLPEADSLGLKAGQVIPIASEDLGAKATSATVAQVYPAVVAGRVAVDLDASGLDERLIGQRIRLEFKVGQRQALVAPKRLVLSRYGVDYVRVLARSGAAYDVPVQLAPGASPETVEILSGVEAGDALVEPRGAPGAQP